MKIAYQNTYDLEEEYVDIFVWNTTHKRVPNIFNKTTVTKLTLIRRYMSIESTDRLKLKVISCSYKYNAPVRILRHGTVIQKKDYVSLKC